MIGVRQKDIRHKLPHLPHVQLKPRTDVLGHSQPSLRDCSRCQLLPRTTSWATLSRPFGTVHAVNSYQDYVLSYSQSSLRDCHAVNSSPELTSGATLSRPFGTIHAVNSSPELTSWATLSRPFGTVHAVDSYQDYVLSYSQPSLRDYSCGQLLPRLASRTTLSRPCGTGSCY